MIGKNAYMVIIKGSDNSSNTMTEEEEELIMGNHSLLERFIITR